MLTKHPLFYFQGVWEASVFVANAVSSSIVARINSDVSTGVLEAQGGWWQVFTPQHLLDPSFC